MQNLESICPYEKTASVNRIQVGVPELAEAGFDLLQPRRGQCG
jgi:hypothetical protein